MIDLWLLVENFTIHSLSAFHIGGIFEFKKNYAHLKQGLMEGIQGAEG